MVKRRQFCSWCFFIFNIVYEWGLKISSVGSRLEKEVDGEERLLFFLLWIFRVFILDFQIINYRM